jgi:hypothetical protein
MKMVKVGVYGDRIDGKWCSPSYQIRLLAAWQASTRIHTILLQQSSDLENIDVVVFQRMSFLDTIGQELLALSLKRGIPTVLDIDDDFEAVSRLIGHEAQNEMEDRIEKFNEALHGFSQVWVSTVPLGIKISGMTESQVRQRPTVPPKSIELPLSKRAERERLRTFLYFGTSTHLSDFEIVRETLEKEVGRGCINASVVGVLQGLKQSKGIQTIQVNRKIATRYNSFIDYLNRIGPFDVGVAPLVDNEVNKSKSGLKVLEYAALGVLPLATNTEAYDWLEKLSLEDLLVPFGVNSWQKKIENLIEMKYDEFEELRLGSVTELNKYAQSLREKNLENDFEYLTMLL